MNYWMLRYYHTRFLQNSCEALITKLYDGQKHTGAFSWEWQQSFDPDAVGQISGCVLADYPEKIRKALGFRVVAGPDFNDRFYLVRTASTQRYTYLVRHNVIVAVTTDKVIAHE